jgi:hypothetical protein
MTLCLPRKWGDEGHGLGEPAPALEPPRNGKGVTHVLRSVPYTDPRNDAAGTVDGELTADGQQAGGVFSVSVRPAAQLFSVYLLRVPLPVSMHLTPGNPDLLFRCCFRFCMLCS